jgi:nicotinate-nucleotide pyrophosphorylase (carboxylating)
VYNNGPSFPEEGDLSMTALPYLLRFVEEDAQFGDITSEAIIGEREAEAAIILKEDAVVAGLEEVETLFSHFGVRTDVRVPDGQLAKKGDCLISLKGDAKKILLVERTALNIIGRMSGIATVTRRYADLVLAVNPRCRVAGTRKTAPGLRFLDKKAIILGGGEPHRFSLSDGILIKDNHLALVSLETAVAQCRMKYAYRPIEVEAETPEEALLAARSGADIILLDNMRPADIQAALILLEDEGLREKVKVEVSGGVDEIMLPEFARLDIDTISIGAITHSVKNIDVSLEIRPSETQGGRQSIDLA